MAIRSFVALKTYKCISKIKSLSCSSKQFQHLQTVAILLGLFGQSSGLLNDSCFTYTLRSTSLTIACGFQSRELRSISSAGLLSVSTSYTFAQRILIMRLKHFFELRVISFVLATFMFSLTWLS